VLHYLILPLAVWALLLAMLQRRLPQFASFVAAKSNWDWDWYSPKDPYILPDTVVLLPLIKQSGHSASETCSFYSRPSKQPLSLILQHSMQKALSLPWHVPSQQEADN
jgi:hypothetical protein